MNSKPTKLHAINKLIEISLVSENITPIQREIDLAVPLHMPLQNLYGFAGTATDNNIYLFGGFTVTEYSDEEEDLYISHTPHSNRSTLLPRSSVLYHIDIEKKTLSASLRLKNFPQQMLLYMLQTLILMVKLTEYLYLVEHRSK